MGSRIVNGICVHVYLKEVSIPSSDNNGTQLAYYLATIISLVRMVTNNFEAIQIMTKIQQQDDLEFLSPPAEQDHCYREDSESECSNANSSFLSLGANWEEDKKKLRVLEKIENELKELSNNHYEQYMSSSWEDIVFNNHVA